MDHPLSFHWLAGLLEAEGSFMKGVPSAPNLPLVACSMTDRDTLGRVAAMFGTAAIEIDKGRYRTEYRTTAKGARAAALMCDLRDLMGIRRQSAIDAALSRYAPPTRKLCFEQAETIRERYRNGATVSALARDNNVRRSTIRQLLQRRIYREAKDMRYPWRFRAPWLPCQLRHPALSSTELCWLAGWLEGEGSFLKPPPSDRVRCRVSGQCRDLDVISRVASDFGVTPSKCDRARAEARGWSPSWKALARGPAAEALMRSVRPIMCQRRIEQIDAALGSVETVGIEPTCTVA